MGKVVCEISMSLDGFVTGPDPDLARGLGHGGEPLHEWALGARTAVDDAVLAESAAGAGAVVLGRRTFDIVDGPHGWGDNAAFGGERGDRVLPPNFVVTHRPPERVRLTEPFTFTFVTTGVADAVAQAQRAAGDREVSVMGGASIIRQCLAAGLADELRLHLAPVLLGGGTRLFEDAPPAWLYRTAVRDSPNATHLYFALDR
jgi:dihydrofolate reductase